MDEWANKKAKVRDILTHVSGLPRCVGLVLWVSDRETKSLVLSYRD